jgi:hypothetical protein
MSGYRFRRVRNGVYAVYYHGEFIGRVKRYGVSTFTAHTPERRTLREGRSTRPMIYDNKDVAAGALYSYARDGSV